MTAEPRDLLAALASSFGVPHDHLKPPPSPVLSALACGDEHPITGYLCARIGCDGNHQYDGGPDWVVDTDTKDA